MEKQNQTKIIINKIQKAASLATLFASLAYANFSSNQNSQTQQYTKINIPKNEVKVIENDSIQIDFTICKNIKDIFGLLQQNGCIVDINPSKYFNNPQNKILLDKLLIKNKSEFINLYYKSDILRYAIYTQLLPKSENENINTLNNDYQIQFYGKTSGYISYINIPNSLKLSNFDQTLEQISPSKYFTSLPIKIQTKNPLSNIKKGKIYKENGEIKLPWQKVNEIFRQNGILVKSSAKLFDEKGNNKHHLRTCLHGMKLSTINFIVRLSNDLKSKYGSDIMHFHPLVITGGTENGHKDNKNSSNDHPDGAKFDLSITGEKGIILAVYFAKNGVLDFSYKEKYVTGYDNKTITNVGNYAILVHPNKGSYGVHFDILVKK